MSMIPMAEPHLRGALSAASLLRSLITAFRNSSGNPSPIGKGLSGFTKAQRLAVDDAAQ